MRSLVLALLATSLLVAPPARARDHGDLPGSINLGQELQDPARWAPRHDSRDARFVITSENGKVDLLLTPTTVAFQLSDRCMSRIERELRDQQNEDEDNALGDAIKTAVLAGVREFRRARAGYR